MLAAILGLLIGLTIHNIFGLPNKTDIEQIVYDHLAELRQSMSWEQRSPFAEHNELLTWKQVKWLRDNGPFERVLCQSSGPGHEYINYVTGKTVRIIPGAGLPEELTYRHR